MLFAQIPPPSFWNKPAGSSELWMMIIVAILLGVAVIFGLMSLPSQWRKYVIGGVTFIAGLFWILFFFWPRPIGRGPDEMPANFKETVSFWLEDAVPIVSDFSNILTTFLLGLGIYSLVRIHSKRMIKMGTDWGYSLVLLIAMVAQAVFGFWHFHDLKGPSAALVESGAGWHFQNYASDLLFDGMYQQFDAAMFSVIAFYLLSAAYRAFRIRSAEATLLLGTALIVMLSSMGMVTYFWDTKMIQPMAGNSQFLLNFQLSEVSRWISNTMQTPSLRGIDFGIGIGTVAMGLRLWLSLEKTGGIQ
jgi:hypothetical protein